MVRTKQGQIYIDIYTYIHTYIYIYIYIYLSMITYADLTKCIKKEKRKIDLLQTGRNEVTRCVVCILLYFELTMLPFHFCLLYTHTHTHTSGRFK